MQYGSERNQRSTFWLGATLVSRGRTKGEEVAFMSFPERLLGEDEHVVYDLRPHWWTLVPSILMTLLVLVLATLAYGSMPGGTFQAPARLVVQVVAVAVLAVWVGPRVARWATTHLVLTTDRLIFRTGLVAKYAREIPLERIDDVTYSQSLFGRLIGVGDLQIHSGSEHGEAVFEQVRNPKAVQLEIYHRMEQSESPPYTPSTPPGPYSPPRPAPPSPSGSPYGALDDLERLAALRDRGLISDEEFDRKKRDLLDRI
jgi:membrane protein YdbS with pleckstrin-like domain